MLEIISIKEEEKWNAVVKRQKNYDVFYLASYVKAFQQQGEGEPILIHCIDEEKSAISVMFKRDIAECEYFKNTLPAGEYFDLISPYGYGGFWGENGVTEAMLDEYAAFCRDNHFVCEFVRFELNGDYCQRYKGETETRTHNVVRNLEMPIDEMLMDFEHKVRKNIKHAQRANLNILIEENDDHLEDFLRIYYGTMERNGASEIFYFKREFFETINEMSGQYVYIYVIYQEKIISAELIIFGSENAYSYLGGTDKDYFDVRPNDFLKFEAIKWLKERGLKNFVLGGGYGADDGIFRYKKSLAPNGIVDFYIGRNIFDQGLYDKLTKDRLESGDMLEDTYFPLYRAPKSRKEETGKVRQEDNC